MARSPVEQMCSIIIFLVSKTYDSDIRNLSCRISYKIYTIHNNWLKRGVDRPISESRYGRYGTIVCLPKSASRNFELCVCFSGCRWPYDEGAHERDLLSIPFPRDYPTTTRNTRKKKKSLCDHCYCTATIPTTTYLLCPSLLFSSSLFRPVRLISRPWFLPRYIKTPFALALFI